MNIVEDETFSDDGKKVTPGEYSKAHFSMFGGEEDVVTVRFNNSLIGVVLDRFGKDVSIIPKGNEYFDTDQYLQYQRRNVTSDQRAGKNASSQPFCGFHRI